MFDRLEEPNWLKEDYAALTVEWRRSYSIAISEMEKWAGKELGYIRSNYAAGPAGASERSRKKMALQVDELNTLRRLNTIRIAKHYATEAEVKIGDVNSVLGDIQGYKAICRFTIDGLKVLGEPEQGDDNGEEFSKSLEKAEKAEALLKAGRAALEAFEGEMYGQLEVFTALKA